jgi:hypothetical protein
MQMRRDNARSSAVGTGSHFLCERVRQFGDDSGFCRGPFDHQMPTHD